MPRKRIGKEIIEEARYIVTYVSPVYIATGEGQLRVRMEDLRTIEPQAKFLKTLFARGFVDSNGGCVAPAAILLVNKYDVIKNERKSLT